MKRAPSKKRAAEQGSGPAASTRSEGCIALPDIPSYASNNAHMFYLVCKSLVERTALIDNLKKHGILSVFHYLSLHKSPFYASRHDGRELPHADHFSDCLLRLPMYYELSRSQVEEVCSQIRRFFG